MVLIQKKGFTLIEILIVIAIIAILAASIIPNFIGFDTEARVTTTKSNLEAIRTRINLFRAKEGKYPKSLGDLTTTYYYDAGIKKLYLEKVPVEMLSDAEGTNLYVDMTSQDSLGGEGGWVYLTDTAEIQINMIEPLGKKWGSFADDIPSEW